MLGLGGQIMLAVPEMDLVVVTTADTQGMGGATDTCRSGKC